MSPSAISPVNRFILGMFILLLVAWLLGEWQREAAATNQRLLTAFTAEAQQFYQEVTSVHQSVYALQHRLDKLNQLLETAAAQGTPP